MLDIDLEDGRAAKPKPRASREPVKRANKPSEDRWRWAGPEPATEAMLRAEMDRLYQSLCNLDWSEAAASVERGAAIWAALPTHVWIAIDPDFPAAPGPLSENLREAWAVYAVWNALWWHRQAPRIDHVEGRLDVCPF